MGYTKLNENSGRALAKLKALKSLNANDNPSSFLPFLPESIEYLNAVSVNGLEDNAGLLPSNLKSLRIFPPILQDHAKAQAFLSIVIDKKIKELRIQNPKKPSSELEKMTNVIFLEELPAVLKFLKFTDPF